jgi:hypothetical protein
VKARPTDLLTPRWVRQRPRATANDQAPARKTEDETHTCLECGQTFTVTARDRQFYAVRGWDLPKRCGACRAKRREHKGEQGPRQ